MEKAIAVFCGATMILYGTALYWPLERFRDWQAGKVFGHDLGFRIHHGLMTTIRGNRWLRLLYRCGLVAVGTIALAFGLS